MNYLELHNAVLDRLRERRATAGDIGLDPYFNSIGAHINDAKHQVEHAWQWGSLRDSVEIPLVGDARSVVLPDSKDRNYVIKAVKNQEESYFLRWIAVDRMRGYYVGEPTNPVNQNKPGSYATGEDDTATGNKTITVFPPSNATYTLEVFHWKPQAPLVAFDDELKVPSLPVYTLATALASRERGEVGGTPTSELFAVASEHLADAIAYDSARFPEDLDWWADDRLFNTNVRTA